MLVLVALISCWGYSMSDSATQWDRCPNLLNIIFLGAFSALYNRAIIEEKWQREVSEDASS